MSYDHKDLVQRESRAILSNAGWVTTDGHTWRRKPPKIKCPDCKEGFQYSKQFIFFTKQSVCPRCGGLGKIEQ